MSEITTPQALDALPVGSVVLDRHGDAWQKTDDTGRKDPDGERLASAWASTGAWFSDRTAREIFEGGPENFTDYGRLGPVTVLYRPDAPGDRCERCGRARREHRPGYSAHHCTFLAHLGNEVPS
jgi:hypothetical protein